VALWVYRALGALLQKSGSREGAEGAQCHLCPQVIAVSHVISKPAMNIWLIRHGETEWSKSGRHTGTTDVALTEQGRRQASALPSLLSTQAFDLVLTSPMQRAIDTCRLAGLGEQAQVEPDLHEWNYGVYEGRKTADIREEVPDWSVWTSPIPEGESAAQVGTRAQRLIDRLLSRESAHIALFSHAHFLRALAAVWTTGEPSMGAHLALDTAAVGVLGFEREVRVIAKWNLQQSVDQPAR
jgi:broad specificity phosphatase PhoE